MKLSKKLFFFIIILTLAYGCRTTKTVFKDKEIVVKDTVTITKDRIITKEVNKTLIVEQPCDSLGQLKDFDKEIQTDVLKVSLKSVKGSIKVKVNLDSIKQIWEKEYKSNFKSKKEIVKEKIVITKTPIWSWVYIISSTIIIFLLIKLKWF